MHSIAEKIISEIKLSENILIVPSSPVDDDCIGTALAIKRYIQLNFKKLRVEIKHFGVFKERYENFPGIDEVIFESLSKVEFEQYDKIVLVDGSDWNVFFGKDWAGYLANIPIEKFVHIDHHIKSSVHKKLKGKSIVENSSSTAEVFYKYFLQTQKSKLIDKKIATYLCYALAGDTGIFKHAIYEDTFKFADILFNSGAKYYQAISNDVTSVNMNFTADLITKTEHFPEAKTTILCLDDELLGSLGDKYGSKWKKYGYLDHYQLVYRLSDSDYYFILKESADSIRINWRSSSSSKLNILKVLEKIPGFQGGGHRNAGGGNFPSVELSYVKAKILNTIKDEL